CWEKQIPLRVVDEVVEVASEFQLVAADRETQAVRDLGASFLIEIRIGSALAGDQQVRDLKVRLFEHGEEIKAAPRKLKAGFVDRLRPQHGSVAHQKCLIESVIVPGRGGCR